MPALTTQQRNTLESAVKQARKQAETGARNALNALAVDHPEPFAHLTPAQRTMRNRLRSKARLLGDELKNSGHQEMDHLGYEMAYEYWHKMLFARFLEANGLLMHPDGVAVTMEECEELAKEEGHADKWEAAAAYASRMLPAIFRPEDPLMQVPFASNDRIQLEQVLDGLDDYIFTADDALGWVYQFWQSEAKAAINASGDKIDGEKLPAVTQLFTEPYMVHFLIDNTLGAWWVSRNPGVTPPVKFEYLRVLEDGTPAAGTFEGWPNQTAEITTLDPCMGSGHFIASLFTVLAKLRMYEDRLSKEEATDRVIADNLHGLELDPRCTQIAAFNLALTAWKFCGHYKPLPEMHLACSGVAPKGKLEDWVKLVSREKDAYQKQRLENGMETLYRHFQLAPELGSLLDPTTIKPDAITASFNELQPVLEKALEGEADSDQVERGVMAAGIAKAGQLLAKKYMLQITNVPYLGKGKFDSVLTDYVMKHYQEAKGDLATIFLERLFKTSERNGTVTTVIPQNWLFLTTYKKYREKLLKSTHWDFVARLGPGAFSQISGEVVKAILVSISNNKPVPEHSFFGLDVSEAPNAAAKDAALKVAELKQVNQREQLGNPDARLIMGKINTDLKYLGEYATPHVGLQNNDTPRFICSFWEIGVLNYGWTYFQLTSSRTEYYEGLSGAVKWPPQKEYLIKGKEVWGKKGVLVRQTASLPVTLYLGNVYDQSSSVILPKKTEYLIPIWMFLSDSEYNEQIREIDQSLAVTNDTFTKVPFDFDYWKEVAAEKYPNGLPKPYSDDPTQWLFHGHPIKTERPLQVALARYLGYRWPAEQDEEMELAPEARELIAQVKAFDEFTDEDGILCIPAVNGELPAAERLRSYLQQVYGSQWNSNSITQLLAAEGSRRANLEDWLRDEFFEQHYKLFRNRPFIWHIWDGRKDGFGALVNYHQLTKETLQRLIYTYLGDWIRQCEAKKKNGESGAEGLLSAAFKLRDKLLAILEGEAPYDIFVRWKPLEQQPIGWDPDLNDGVRLNIRPLITADVLRKKPNIKWGIDRGKNPPGSPWGEVRDNDRHLTLEEKRNAREKIGK
jgi:hypothetical protein